MPKTISSALALALLLAACGDDDSGSTSGDDDDTAGDEGTNGDGGSGYTLADALKTSGTDVSDDRSKLLLKAACEKRIGCSKETLATCTDIETKMFESGKKAGFDDNCLDATLDSYACYATNDCNDFDTKCNDVTATALAACKKYTSDGGT